MSHRIGRVFPSTFVIIVLAGLIFSGKAFCNPPDTLRSANDTTVKVPAIPAKKADVYRVNYYLTGSIILVGGVGDYFAISRLKHKQNLTDAEIAALNPGILNSIDRWALKQDYTQRKTFAKVSDYTESAIFIIPALMMIDKRIRKEWLDVLAMYVEGHAITFSIYNYGSIGPTFHNEYRPMTFYDSVPMPERRGGGTRNSIYSGHVASVAYTTFFMAKVFCDFYPEMSFGNKFLLYAGATIPPVLEGYFRVRALAHFPSECLTGLVLGAAIGIIVPELHKRHLKNFTLGMYDAPGGAGLSVCWNVR